MQIEQSLWKMEASSRSLDRNIFDILRRESDDNWGERNKSGPSTCYHSRTAEKVLSGDVNKKISTENRGTSLAQHTGSLSKSLYLIKAIAETSGINPVFTSQHLGPTASMTASMTEGGVDLSSFESRAEDVDDVVVPLGTVAEENQLLNQLLDSSPLSQKKKLKCSDPASHKTVVDNSGGDGPTQAGARQSKISDKILRQLETPENIKLMDVYSESIHKALLAMIKLQANLKESSSITELPETAMVSVSLNDEQRLIDELGGFDSMFRLLKAKAKSDRYPDMNYSQDGKKIEIASKAFSALFND